MDFRFMPAAGFARSRWTPFAAPMAAMELGQAGPPAPSTPAPGPVQTPAPVAPAPPAPFIDSAVFSFVFDGAIAVAGVIAGSVWWKLAREEAAPAKKASNKRAAYVFYGIAGVAAVKGVLDGGRIMR